MLLFFFFFSSLWSRRTTHFNDVYLKEITQKKKNKLTAKLTIRSAWEECAINRHDTTPKVVKIIPLKSLKVSVFFFHSKINKRANLIFFPPLNSTLRNDVNVFPDELFILVPIRNVKNFVSFQGLSLSLLIFSHHNLLAYRKPSKFIRSMRKNGEPIKVNHKWWRQFGLVLQYRHALFPSRFNLNFAFFFIKVKNRNGNVWINQRKGLKDDDVYFCGSFSAGVDGQQIRRPQFSFDDMRDQEIGRHRPNQKPTRHTDKV